MVKALLAKKLASHFHKQAHFQKMRDAIKKVPIPCTSCEIASNSVDFMDIQSLIALALDKLRDTKHTSLCCMLHSFLLQRVS